MAGHYAVCFALVYYPAVDVDLARFETFLHQDHSFGGFGANQLQRAFSHRILLFVDVDSEDLHPDGSIGRIQRNLDGVNEDQLASSAFDGLGLYSLVAHLHFYVAFFECAVGDPGNNGNHSEYFLFCCSRSQNEGAFVVNDLGG